MLKKILSESSEGDSTFKSSARNDSNISRIIKSNNVETLRDELIKLDSELQNKVEELKVSK